MEKKYEVRILRDIIVFALNMELSIDGNVRDYKNPIANILSLFT